MKKGKKVSSKVSKVVKGGTKGRPVDPTSVRQLRLAELAVKRENGTLKKGRPVNETSARQLRLADINTRKANGTFKKGRPVSKTSKRQIRLAELDVKRKNGTLSKGRPVDMTSNRQVKLAEKASKVVMDKIVNDEINDMVQEVIDNSGK